MSSNTKLCQDQKNWLKTAKADFKKRGGLIFEYSGITVAIVRDFESSKFCTVSISYKGEKERKFRRKVGEFYALRKLLADNEYIKVPFSNNLEYTALRIFEAVEY